MKKRILGAVLALACMGSVNVFAAETNPVVKVNDREIVFADQKPVIIEGENRTMVPARGVFEYMGADVSWDGDKQLVKIEQDGCIIEITIGNDVMNVYTYSVGSILAGLADPSVEQVKKQEIKLDAVPRIMNDRTMIPLRAISESLNADVSWDGDANTVSIKTKDYNAPVVGDTADADSAVAVEKNVALSLSASAETVKAGETVDVIVNVANLKDKGISISGFAFGFIYDRTKLEFVEGSMQSSTIAADKYLTAVNTEFSADSIKIAGITADESGYMKEDGEFVKFTFKVLTDEKATIQLSNRYSNDYDTMLTVDNNGKVESVDAELYIDTTAVEIN